MHSHGFVKVFCVAVRLFTVAGLFLMFFVHCYMVVSYVLCVVVSYEWLV